MGNGDLLLGGGVCFCGLLVCIYTYIAAFGWYALWTEGWGNWFCHALCHLSPSEMTSVSFICWYPSKRIEILYSQRHGHGIAMGFTGNSALSHIIEWETKLNSDFYSWYKQALSYAGRQTSMWNTWMYSGTCTSINKAYYLLSIYLGQAP